MMSCQECREELAEYALGQTETAHAQSVRDHVAACPVCRQELADIEAAWAALPLSLTPAAPSPELFDRVLSRIGDQPNIAVSVPIARSPRLTRRERILSYVVAASMLLALTSAYIHLSPPSDGDDPAAQIW